MAWEPTDLEQQRLQKLERLRSKGIDPFPRRAKRTHTAAEAVAALQAAGPEDRPAVTVGGRLRSFRAMGKIAFAHIEDESGRVQLFLRNDQLGDSAIKTLVQDLDLGDFVEAGGVMVHTRTGEPSVLAENIRLLAKAISPLPVIKEQELDGQLVRYSAFSDVEERFRQRYADLASNLDVRQIFRTRAKVISALRRFMDEEGFLEVETPILQPIYGGAAARPFTTHHNQLHQDLYLRISFELYLKRLLVGMYDRVYEIGRDFRNEGVSQVHNPEFTQLEFYAAYIDYHGVMDLTERMISFVAERVTGGTTIQYQGNSISLSRPWHRVTLRQAIKDSAGIDYVQYPTAEGLAAAMRAQGHRPDPKSSWGKLVDSLLGTHVQPGLIQPTFVLDYPRDISPLAKTKPGDQTHVERFEFFIGGMELGNAFTEINDPLDQEQRFLEMGRLYGADDEESHPMDEDYLRAMRYGMPPCGGFGTGVDRLVMLFTDQRTIREVLLFPHLRSRD
jgi:lysyl-tRNA synthetase class 2